MLSLSKIPSLHPLLGGDLLTCVGAHLLSCDMCVCLCVHTCVKTRSQPQTSFLGTLPILFYVARSFTGLVLANLVRLADQKASRICKLGGETWTTTLVFMQALGNQTHEFDFPRTHVKLKYFTN